MSENNNQRLQSAPEPSTPHKTSSGGRLSYSIKRLVAESDLGRSLVYECLRDGRLRAKKIGRRVVIPGDVARDFINNAPSATFVPLQKSKVTMLKKFFVFI
jgi:hypothetical protein